MVQKMDLGVSCEIINDGYKIFVTIIDRMFIGAQTLIWTRSNEDFELEVLWGKDKLDCLALA